MSSIITALAISHGIKLLGQRYLFWSQGSGSGFHFLLSLNLRAQNKPKAKETHSHALETFEGPEALKNKIKYVLRGKLEIAFLLSQIKEILFLISTFQIFKSHLSSWVGLDGSHWKQFGENMSYWDSNAIIHWWIIPNLAVICILFIDALTHHQMACHIEQF